MTRHREKSLIAILHIPTILWQTTYRHVIINVRWGSNPRRAAQSDTVLINLVPSNTSRAFCTRPRARPLIRYRGQALSPKLCYHQFLCNKPVSTPGAVRQR